MKIGRSFTLMAAGLLSIGLVFSLPAYADHHEGMEREGSGMMEEGSMKEGSGMMGEHKSGMKEEGSLKEEGKMEGKGDMEEGMKKEGSGPM